jgi:DNA-binding LytR/AlgR family response regulator
MAWNNCSILLIDADETSAWELAELLMNRPEPPKICVAASVASAEPILRTQRVEWVFIRIISWDDYQQLRPTLIHAPKGVIFLSGRNEKCTAHLNLALDGHLQPPYRPGHLLRVWNRWKDPGFAARPLDLLFVKSRARFEPVRYGDIWQVEVENGGLRVQTRHADYRVSGSLQAFQERLPVTMTMVRRGCLVNERFGPDGASVRARS